MATKQYKYGKSKHGTKAIHADLPDGGQAVGIGNLRVFIVPDGKFWFAKGLEIDYATQGDTLDDAKDHFVLGLAGTIDLHLQMHGSIEKLLQPSDFLQEAYRLKAAIHYCSFVSVHDMGIQSQLDFPLFGGIDFYKIEKEAA
jgi:hypothetical protein